MFNAERLLGSVLQQALSGGMGRSYHRNSSRRHSYRGDLSSQLGVTLLGVAVAAVEHYFSNPASTASGASNVPSGVTRVPPPPPGSGAASVIPPPSPAPGTTVIPGETVDPLLLVRTMIAAAAADGVIDDQERARLLSNSAVDGLSLEETQYLETLLKSPPSVESLTAEIVSRAAASQMYLAALLAINVDSVAEESFLRTLAEGLSLSAEDTKMLRMQALGN